jgi:hypothetical protein
MEAFAVQYGAYLGFLLELDVGVERMPPASLEPSLFFNQAR